MVCTRCIGALFSRRVCFFCFLRTISVLRVDGICLRPTRGRNHRARVCLIHSTFYTSIFSIFHIQSWFLFLAVVVFSFFFTRDLFFLLSPHITHFQPHVTLNSFPRTFFVMVRSPAWFFDSPAHLVSRRWAIQVFFFSPGAGFSI